MVIAEFKNSRAGCNAIWLTASNGDKFYYPHLETHPVGTPDNPYPVVSKACKDNSDNRSFPGVEPV